VENFENEDNAKEQDNDRNDGELDEAQAKEVDKRKDRDDAGKEDKEKDAQDEEEREEEAEGEHEAEEASDNIEKPHKTGGKDGADEDEQAEENEDEDDEMAGEESGNHDEVREDGGAMKQRVAANNCNGARRDCKLGDITDKEEERNTGSGGDEMTAGENDGDPKERRKRSLETCEAFDCPTPGDRPNKRSKGDDSESEDTLATDHLARRTFSPETTPRPRTPSPTSTTASPGSIFEIVRQTSVLPGLEDIESAVCHAAQRDSVISSLPPKQQGKMVRTALALSSEEGIEELRRFVSNARRRGEHRSQSLVSDFNLITSRLDPTIELVGNALVPQSDCLASLSALYQRLDVLESKGTLFTIARRANLAAMAWYRQSIVPKGVGGTRARDANLKIFRAIFPHYPTLERPEDNPAASRDWSRLRLWLMEGSTWLDVHRLFGGDGAFLALPPQCVPDSHVSRLPAKRSISLLGLLDVAWRALDDDARRTMNALVRLALAGQPLPGAALALERSDIGTSAATTGLSPLLAGWSVIDCATEWHGDPATARSTEREMEWSENTLEAVRTTSAGIYTENVLANAKSSIRKETVSLVDNGLLENVDFDEPLSQQL
jgi:hypothetical protein